VKGIILKSPIRLGACPPAVWGPLVRSECPPLYTTPLSTHVSVILNDVVELLFIWSMVSFCDNTFLRHMKKGKMACAHFIYFLGMVALKESLFVGSPLRPLALSP
jgi:hypothetical protein